ncbi:MAG: class I SAM-dependent methyltransferase [Deltaproteobacteria bacterium]|nr:class I SAM-dependent methyltransferase [Deltaproteobacteria bacterium]
MDIWKYYGITHADHTVMNPMSSAKMSELIERLGLPSGARVLDLGCGKAEFLCLLAERYDVRGTGVELSPITIEAARKNVAARGLNERIELLHLDGAAYAHDGGTALDLAACIGASWIYHGHKGTLEALSKLVQPGGLVLVGEPFWKCEPAAAYLKLTEQSADLCGTHASNVQAGIELGLSFLYAVVSNDDDWDRYEGLQWQAAERYAATHPNDPDIAPLLQTSNTHRDAYLRWGRECLGWAMYLFQKPREVAPR